MLSDKEIRKVVDALGETALSLVYRQGDGRSSHGDEMLAFARQLESVSAGRISVLEESGNTLFGEPCLRVGENIFYLTVPDGMELQPFFEALARLSNAPVVDREARLGSAELTVFVASQCPHCPHAARAALGLALENPMVVCVVADAQRNTRVAEQFKVQSVPLTLLDRRLSWTGVLTAGEVAQKIRARNTPEHKTEVLCSLVESGRLQEAAETVMQEGGPDWFAEVWRQSTTSTRIGLMMVVEEVLEKEPSALNEAVNAIGASVDSEDAALRGDTADLLGQIGHPDAVPFLERLREDPNPDVVEIADEALEEIAR